MHELLGICINIFDDGRFQFYQTGLVLKVLEATWMDNSNGLPVPKKVEAYIGTYENVTGDRKYWTNSYEYFIGKMLYLK